MYFLIPKYNNFLFIFIIFLQFLSNKGKHKQDKMKVVLFILLLFIPIMMAKESGKIIELKGKWVNELGSLMEI